MGVFNVFKPQWSSQNMTAEDRKKIFWYLQRKTSFTAWKRVADEFDRFALVFEKQVREEPMATAPGRVDGTAWERYYPEILTGQVLYEKGLDALRRGDRTVWFCNERGILDDAETIADHWYVALVNHGPHGDVDFDGRYVEELTDAMKRFSKISHDTSQVIQPRMAETPAPHAWTTFWRTDFEALPLPARLPEPPILESETLIRTGELAPVFGIYEPQLKDGCMNYLLATIPAPPLWETDGTNFNGQKRAVTWRLIWADKRYVNGVIPVEEASYFPVELPYESPTCVPDAPDLV